MDIKVYVMFYLVSFVDYTTGASVRVGKTCIPPWSLSGSEGSCGCVDDIVLCQRLSMIRPFRNNTKYKRLQITNSNITLSDMTFHNLNVSELILSNNKILFNVTNEKLFLTETLKKNVKVLGLPNNNLPSLPELIISNLDVLQSLDISGNPIPDSQFTEDIFRSIGDTLEVFAFGHSNIASWPRTLKHLQMLKKLNVSEASFFLIPERAFYGFEGTLRQLVIQRTKLLSIPFAVGRLLFLDTLYFDHNRYVGDVGLRVPQLPGLLPYLTNVSLIDDGAKTLPESLSIFNKLKNLDVSKNDLEFVSDQSAKNINRVTSLSMRNSNISRIPGSLHTMTSLMHLDLSSNNIHSLETNDLTDLSKLKVLRLDNNPILYMNRDVFAYLFELKELYLANTNLTIIPCAVGGIKKDTALIDLTGNQIECNCNLKWIQDWISDNKINLTFLGKCSTVESSIQEYIENYLPLCPPYHRDCYAKKIFG